LRAVTTATAAAVLAVNRRALDSLLARLDSPLLPRGRQGVERRIPVHLLEALLLTTELAQRLQVPVREAFAIALELTGVTGAKAKAASSEHSGSSSSTPDARDSVAVGDFAMLQVDRHALKREIEHRLATAIESIGRPRRGRPRRRDEAGW